MERAMPDGHHIPKHAAEHLADVEVLPGDGTPDETGVLPPYARLHATRNVMAELRIAVLHALESGMELATLHQIIDEAKDVFFDA